MMSSAVYAAAIPFCALAVVALGGCGGGDFGSGTSKTPEVLYSFGDSSLDSTIPDRGLLKGSDGNFYGATAFGGASGNGAVFKITPTGQGSVLHSFAGGPADGASPATVALIQGHDGNFYGATGGGGANDLGTVYMLTPEGALTILHSFAGGTGDGAVPSAALLQGSDGNFYGTTLKGGTNDTGTIFKLTPSGVDAVLYSFAPLGQPTITALDSSFIQGSDGNFYGVSIDGGASNQGTVFSVSPTGVVTLLHSFGSSGDGIQPNAGLIFGSDGNLYGTTTDGGANNAGAVFKLTPGGSETILYSFKGRPGDGNFPYAGLFQDSDGNFYGTTEHGGENDLGVVFKLTPDGVETILYSFTGGPADGDTPFGNLVQGSDGNLYGMTLGGGANNKGTFFKFSLN